MPTNLNTDALLNAVKKYKFPLIGLSVAIVLFLIGIAMYNSARNEGISKESGLNAQYLANQGELSKYISGFYEISGAANVKSAKLNAILLDAVKGRYDTGSAAVPNTSKGSALFTALAEAYPNLDGLNIYDRLADYIAAGRQSYQDQQAKLLDMLAAYDRYRKQGILRHMFVSMAGFPSDDLRAPVGGTVLRGQAAEDKMWSIVLTPQAVKAYQDGTMDPLTVPSGQ